jgi:hypothetical protein
LAYHIYVIQLAREVECPWILPSAFYTLSTFFFDLGPKVFHGTEYNGVAVDLSLQDQRWFIRGHDIQTSSTTFTKMLQFLFDPISIQGCQSPDRGSCTLERLSCFRFIISLKHNSPLHIMTPEIWEGLGDFICSVCAAQKQTYQAARQRFWDNLPGIYGLPPWPELTADRAAAIGAELALLI